MIFSKADIPKIMNLWEKYIEVEELNSLSMDLSKVYTFQKIRKSCLTNNTITFPDEIIKNLLKKYKVKLPSKEELTDNSILDAIRASELKEKKLYFLFILVEAFDDFQKETEYNKVQEKVSPLLGIELNPYLVKIIKSGSFEYDPEKSSVNTPSHTLFHSVLQKSLALDNEELAMFSLNNGLLEIVEQLTNIRPDTLESSVSVFEEYLDKQDTLKRYNGDFFICDVSDFKPNFNLLLDLQRIKNESWKYIHKNDVSYKYLFSSYKNREEIGNKKDIYYGSFHKYPLTFEQAEVVKLLNTDENTISVQGPPGTGKTTLILGVLARQITQRAIGNIINNEDQSNLTVVASTNTKAVENIIEGLKDTFKEIPFFYFIGGSKSSIKKYNSFTRLENTIDLLNNGTFDNEKQNLYTQKIKSILKSIDTSKLKYDTYIKNKNHLELNIKETSYSINDIKNFFQSNLKDSINDLQDELEFVRNQISHPFFKFINFLTFNMLLNKKLKCLSRENETLLKKLNMRKITTILKLLELDFTLETLLKLLETFSKLQLFLEENNLNSYEDVPDFYEDYRIKYNVENLELFNLSRKYLWQKALQNKQGIINSLLLYKRATSSTDKQSSTAFRELVQNNTSHFKNISLLYPIFTSTLHSIRNTFPFLTKNIIKLSLIDEAGMIPCHQAFPLLCRSEKCIVVGDLKQIEPVITFSKFQEEKYWEEWNNEGFNSEAYTLLSPTQSTAFHRACGADESSAEAEGIYKVLDEHRRCQPNIARLFSKIAKYPNMMIKTEPLDKGTPLRNSLEQFASSSVLWFDIDSDITSQTDNLQEVEAIQIILSKLELSGFDLQQDIGVITPFLKQELLLKKKLRSRVPYNRIGTVHKFQGMGVNVIIFSAVKYSEFYCSSPNILNVAISRAKTLFIVVGNYKALNKGNYFSKLCNYISEKGEVLPLSKEENIIKIP
jgi:superfamily I DNA and/or RNA helicase